jgi:hypothetical protein
MITNFSSAIINNIRVIDYDTNSRYYDCEARIVWFIETFTKNNAVTINVRVERIVLKIYKPGPNDSENIEELTFPAAFIKIENIEELPTCKEIRPQLISYKEGDKFIEIGF